MFRPYDKDRVHSPDIEAVTKLLKNNEIWKAVEGFMNEPHYGNPNSNSFSQSPTSSQLFANKIDMHTIPDV